VENLLAIIATIANGKNGQMKNELDNSSIVTKMIMM
jgi:hypothetical protein